MSMLQPRAPSARVIICSRNCPGLARFTTPQRLQAKYQQRRARGLLRLRCVTPVAETSSDEIDHRANEEEKEEEGSVFDEFPFQQYRVGSQSGVAVNSSITFRPQFQFFRWERAWHIIPLKYNGLEEREIQRRMKIKIRNRGRKPWNLGKKHSQEWIANIQRHTSRAMVREDVINNYCRRMHVRLAMTRASNHKRGILKEKAQKVKTEKQKAMTRERRNLKRRLQTQEKRKLQPNLLKVRKPPSPKKPVSEEKKRKISESIRLKWKDPSFRNRMIESMRDHHRSSSVTSSGNKSQNTQRKTTSYTLRECRGKYDALMSTVSRLSVEVNNLEIQRKLVQSDTVVVQEIDKAIDVATSTILKIKMTVEEVEKELGIESEVHVNGHQSDLADTSQVSEKESNQDIENTD